MMIVVYFTDKKKSSKKVQDVAVPTNQALISPKNGKPNCECDYEIEGLGNHEGLEPLKTGTTSPPTIIEPEIIKVKQARRPRSNLKRGKTGIITSRRKISGDRARSQGARKLKSEMQLSYIEEEEKEESKLQVPTTSPKRSSFNPLSIRMPSEQETKRTNSSQMMTQATTPSEKLLPKARPTKARLHNQESFFHRAKTNIQPSQQKISKQKTAFSSQNMNMNMNMKKKQREEDQQCLPIRVSTTNLKRTQTMPMKRVLHKGFSSATTPSPEDSDELENKKTPKLPIKKCRFYRQMFIVSFFSFLV
jgi:hypothetical protein